MSASDCGKRNGLMPLFILAAAVIGLAFACRRAASHRGRPAVCRGGAIPGKPAAKPVCRGSACSFSPAERGPRPVTEKAEEIPGVGTPANWPDFDAVSPETITFLEF